MTERTEANFWPAQQRGIYAIVAAIVITLIIGSIVALAGGEITGNLTALFFGSLIGCMIALRDGYKGPLGL